MMIRTESVWLHNDDDDDDDDDGEGLCVVAIACNARHPDNLYTDADGDVYEHFFIATLMIEREYQSFLLSKLFS